MLSRSLALTALAVAAVPVHAVIQIPTAAFVYTETFDSLTNVNSPSSVWTNDSTLLGWSLFTYASTAITTYNGDTGTGTAGGFKSFGLDADRALGGLGSGGGYFGSPATGAVAGWIVVAFANTAGTDLSGFTLTFDGEQWRDGGNASRAAQTMVLEYGFGSAFGTVSNWITPGGNFDWASPVTSTPAAAVNGNIAGLVTGRGGSVTTSWAAGDTLWVRWIERNDTGVDHALAIDNLTFSVSGTSVPVPGSLALLLGGLVTFFGFAGRRAVRKV